MLMIQWLNWLNWLNDTMRKENKWMLLVLNRWHYHHQLANDSCCSCCSCCCYCTSFKCGRNKNNIFMNDSSATFQCRWSTICALLVILTEVDDKMIFIFKPFYPVRNDAYIIVKYMWYTILIGVVSDFWHFILYFINILL